MPSEMCRCTFSITTMASSTTSPVASVMPNSVSELIENPNSLTNRNVPISETGIVTAGMIVARQSCRNRKMTTMTITIASTRVTSTSWIESETTCVVSTAMTSPCRAGRTSSGPPAPHGTAWPRRARWHWRAAGSRRQSPPPCSGVKLQRRGVVFRANLRVPTSRSSTSPAPTPLEAGLVFRMMLSNCLGSVSRPCTRTAIWKLCLPVPAARQAARPRSPRSVPAARSSHRAPSARAPPALPDRATRASHTCARQRPAHRPRRERASTRRDVHVDVVRDELVRKRLIGRDEPATSTKFEFALVIVMPVLFTAAGRRPARTKHGSVRPPPRYSRSYPVWNVTVMAEVPSLAETDEMYRMPSTPLIDCSSGIVTADSTIEAVRADVVRASPPPAAAPAAGTAKSAASGSKPRPPG